MKPLEQVSCLINSLTNDEDLRQELWVHYLNGNPPDSFSRQLEKIRIEYSDDLELKQSLWNILTNPPSEKFTKVLSHFTDFERSILCFLMLGLTIEAISSVKGICEVRIRQSIANIRYNGIWEKAYGIKEKPIR